MIKLPSLFLPLSSLYSLLDVLADRKSRNGLTGIVLVNGQPQPKYFKCMSGYVVQVHVYTMIICTSHAHHMHITCTSHAHHMHITCTSHAHHMHITCTSHAHHMYIKGTSYAHHMIHV